jgi:hypothetical protein
MRVVTETDEQPKPIQFGQKKPASARRGHMRNNTQEFNNKRINT